MSTNNKKRKASALVSAVEFLEDMSLDSGLPLGPSKTHKTSKKSSKTQGKSESKEAKKESVKVTATRVVGEPAAKRRRTDNKSNQSDSAGASSGSGAGASSSSEDAAEAAQTEGMKTDRDVIDDDGGRYARLEAVQQQLDDFPEAGWMRTASQFISEFIKLNRGEMKELETAVAAYRQEPSAVFVHGDDTWLFPRISARFRLTAENEDLALVATLSVEEEPGLVSTTGSTPWKYPGQVFHGDRLVKINALRDKARAAFASVPAQRLDSAKTLLGEPLVEFGMTQPTVLATLIELLTSPYNIALRVYVNISFAPLHAAIAHAELKDVERMKQGAKASPPLRIPLSLDTWRDYNSQTVHQGPLPIAPMKKSLKRIIAAEAARQGHA